MRIPKIKFVFDRKKKSGKGKTGLIDLRITYVKTQKFIATGIAVYPSQWDEAGQQVCNSLDAMEYNIILSSMRKKTLQIISEMVDAGTIDIAAIPVKLRQQTVTISFLEYVAQRMEKRQVSEYTHMSYVTMYNKVSEFGKFKSFSDITQKNIRDFSEWLHAYVRTERGADGRLIRKKYRQATIYKITSNLSLFISDAVVDGYVQENPYLTKRMSEDKGGTRIEQYLTPEQVKRIEEANMPTPAVAKSRDLFLLQCYTGLAYVDLMTYQFKPDSRGVCRGVRHKTGTEFIFILTEKARELLNKIGYRVPRISNQKYNAHLKIMGDAAGIEMPITSHVGRRTAGSIWLNSGIPIDVVAKCLGHQSIQVTQRAYAKILDTTVVEAFRKAKT